MAAQALDARQIFLEAVEKHATQQWPEFLDAACGGDAELRQRVEVLLKAHGQYNELLDGEGIVATIDQTPSEHPGTQIGPYKLLQQIGEGGMGVVYMAEQSEPIARRVALKIIKPGMDSRQVIARFEAERQALAVMDHPNIAHVLDAGTTESGRPFFVMELVRGIPITEYCDQNQLPIRERLALFATVCQAIQHAHTKGIIHRDIKPTNVLVTRQDGNPVVKVIDFGVAKAMGQQLTEKTLFTEFAQMIGTPLYMSPEQAELSSVDIDTRSDIYSLGVLLYELLTGTTPVSKEQLKQAAFDEIRRIIREDDPPKPSTWLSTADAAPSIAAQRQTEPAKLTRLVRGELDWIVMKALEKDRSRRYETASGFAKDVQRYLNDEQVLACPPSAGYRFGKFARRNRVILTTVSFVIAALIAGSAVATWQAVRATKAQKLAQERLENEKKARQEAIANLRKAREAVDQMLTRVAEEKLLDMPQMELLRKALLEDALRFYEQFLKQKSTDVEIRLETGLARRRVADIHRQLGQYSQAEQQYQQSIAILKELESDASLRIQVQEGLAMSYSWLGHMLISHLERHEDAENAYRQATARWQKLVAERPEQTEFKLQSADCLQRLGNVLRCRGQFQSAEEMLREALSVHKSLATDFPAEPVYQHHLAINHFFLGYLFLNHNQLDEAILEHRQALQIEEKLVADLPMRADYRHLLGEVYLALADLFSAKGDTSAAESAYRRAIGHWKKLSIDFPKVPGNVRHLAFCYHNLGVALHSAGRFEESIASHTEAIELKPDWWQPWLHWQSWWRRAQGYRSLKQWDLAISDCAKAIELGATESDVWLIKAAAHARLNQPDQAIAELKQAIAKGFQDPQQLRNDEDLASLREREDFKKLITELEADNK